MNEVKLNEGDSVTFNISKLVETLNIKQTKDNAELKAIVRNVLTEAANNQNDKG